MRRQLQQTASKHPSSHVASVARPLLGTWELHLGIVGLLMHPGLLVGAGTLG